MALFCGFPGVGAGHVIDKIAISNTPKTRLHRSLQGRGVLSE